MTKYIIFVFRHIFLLLLPLTMGCASMMQGSTESAGISSNPDGATVFVNGEIKGETPVILDLKRKSDYRIELKKEGYQDASASITHNVSGWVWGNVLFGGLIGLAVDACAGGMYKLSTDTIHLDLIPEEGDLPAHLSTGKKPGDAKPKVKSLNPLLKHPPGKKPGDTKPKEEGSSSSIPGPPKIREAPGTM